MRSRLVGIVLEGLMVVCLVWDGPKPLSQALVVDINRNFGETSVCRYRVFGIALKLKEDRVARPSGFWFPMVEQGPFCDAAEIDECLE